MRIAMATTLCMATFQSGTVPVTGTAAPATAPQESPAPPRKVTLPAAGKFRALVGELSEQASVPLVVGEGVEDREIRVDVKDSTFYQALDAICRAHGEANYLTEDDQQHWDPRHLTIGPRPWVEFPTVYVGDFKVVFAGWMRHVTDVESGRHKRQEISLAAYSLPIQPFQGGGGGLSWRFTEVRDGLGHDLLPSPEPAKDSKTDRGVWGPSFRTLRMQPLGHTGSMRAGLLEVLSFRREDGLKALAGRIEAGIAEFEDVKIPLEIGRETPIPGGVCTVTDLTPVKVYSWMETRATLRFKFADPTQAPESVVSEMGTYDRATTPWSYLKPAFRQDIVEVQVEAPTAKWVVLRVSKVPIRISVPFQFENLSFPEGK